MYRDFNGFFIYKTNREVSIVLCAVVKNLGSGQSTQEVGRNTCLSLVFLPTSLVLWPLPASFTTKQSTVEASPFVKYDSTDAFPRRA